MDIKELLPHDLQFFSDVSDVGKLLTLPRVLKARLENGI